MTSASRVDRQADQQVEILRRLGQIERVGHRHVDTGWIAPTFLNGWVDYGPGFQVAQYRRVDDVVSIRGLIKDGSLGVSAFDLPAGFRPPARLIFAVDTGTYAHGRVDIGTSGQVFIIAGSTANVSINLQFSILP